MERAVKVREKARELVSDGDKPSAVRLSQELGFTESDIHRCLNFLEQRGEVKTYTREVLGRKHRLVGVNR